MRNVEIKAKVRDLTKLIANAKLLTETPEKVILQHDTFYEIEKGRLKLRKYEDGTADLIYYERENTEGPKLSNYEKALIPASAAHNVDKVLKKALGDKGVVAKRRSLFMVGQTRVHIDSVAGLGDFMELEVVLKDDESPEDGEKIALDLMEKLGIQKSDLVAGAYKDLLDNEKKS